MHVIAWMQAKAVLQATTVTPETSNSKDNIMTAYSSRKANNSRNKRNYSTANTVWTPAKAGMLAKVAKPVIACREANCSRDTVKIRDDSSSSRDNTARTYSRKVSNSTVEKTATFSRDRSNSTT
jgi:hypothetical protein